MLPFKPEIRKLRVNDDRSIVANFLCIFHRKWFANGFVLYSLKIARTKSCFDISCSNKKNHLHELMEVSIIKLCLSLMAIKSWGYQHRNGRRQTERNHSVWALQHIHDVSLATRCVVVNTNYIVTSFGNNYCVNQTNYHHHHCVRRPQRKHQYVWAQHSHEWWPRFIFLHHFIINLGCQPILGKTSFFHICLSMKNGAFLQIESEWTITNNTIPKHRTNFGYFDHFHNFFYHFT